MPLADGGRLVLRSTNLVRYAEGRDGAGINRACRLKVLLPLESYQGITSLRAQYPVHLAVKQPAFNQNPLYDTNLIRAEIKCQAGPVCADRASMFALVEKLYRPR